MNTDASRASVALARRLASLIPRRPLTPSVAPFGKADVQNATDVPQTPSCASASSPPSTATYHPGSGAVWVDRSEFCSEEGESGRCPERIDLTGHARHLIHGPYTELAAGDWKAIVLFDLCADASKRRLTVSFGADGEYVHTSLESVRQGRQEVILEITFDHRCHAAIGVSLAKAAFHGEIQFLGAWFEQIGAKISHSDD